MLVLLLLIVFLACVAFSFREGLWASALRLVNVVMAAVVAVNFFEPAADILETWVGTKWSYFYDYLAMWGIFLMVFAASRLATEYLSPVRVRFAPIVDRVGSAVCSIAMGWAMVCFTLFSLHTAPLPRVFLGLEPEHPPYFFGTAPDRQWLGFVQYLSQGAFANESTDADGDSYVFDQRGEFLRKYNARRAGLEEFAGRSHSFQLQ